MGKYPIQVMSSFLTERKERLTPDEANALNIKRIEKIDFSGQIHLADNKPTKTGMIIIKKGDLVISGINVAKGALAVYDGDEDVIATIHYSAYSFDTGKLDIEFLKWFVKSPAFVKALQEQTSGGIKTEIKAKKFLALKIPMPPLNDQQLIASRLNEFEQKYKKIQSELQTQSDLIAKLRSSILSDAVSGRLVPQDPTDEPAGVLLECIKAEKEQLVKAGKIKRPKPLPPISDDEIPYELPDGWGWCRIQEITVSMSTGPFGSMLHKSDYVSNGIPVINPTSIIKNHIVPHSGMMISEKTSQKLSRYKMQKNDIIIARRGDLSKCAIVTETEDGWLCGTGSFILRLSKYINRKYFILFFTSSFCQSVLNGTSVGTTMSNLNQGVLNSILFPLPSTTLQCQIVEKVEKLMATCDQLEAEVQKSRTEIDRLMQTVLKEAFA